MGPTACAVISTNQDEGRTLLSTAPQSELNRNTSLELDNTRRAASGSAPAPIGSDDGRRLLSALAPDEGDVRSQDVIAELDELVDAFLPHAAWELAETREDRVYEGLERRWPS